MDSKSSLTFTFEGDYEVDALSMVTAVQGLIKISDEIARQNYPDIQFRLSIRALSPGSLNFDFVAYAVPVVQNLFTPSNIEYAKNLIECVKTSFEIKSFLKGSRPNSKKQSGDFITIENRDGSKMTVPQGQGVYFINSTIDQSITGIFETSSKSPGVSGIKISHGNSTVEIPLTEFPLMSEKIDMKQIPAENIPAEKNTLL